jgi:hypothetical protein
LTEKNHAPVGIYIGLISFDEQQFSEEKDNLKSRLNIDIRSFLTTKNRS